MASKHLENYLQDHSAGAATAVEILEYLASRFKGSDVERFAIDLRNNIIADRSELERLMERLDIAKSGLKQASAWISEKFVQLKFGLEDPKGNSLRLLEATEMVSLGIEGKRLLWKALSTAAITDPHFQGPNYDQLIQRAQEQRDRVETFRLRGAREVIL